MSETFVIKDSSVLPVDKYVVLLLDADSLELLDYTHTGSVNVERAYKLIVRLAQCFKTGQARQDILGVPLELDAVFEGGHVKVLFDYEAGLLRALVDEGAL